MQIHPLGIDIDLSRSVLMGRESFCQSKIFLPVENVLPVESFLSFGNIFCRDNLVGECRGWRVNCRGPEIRVTIFPKNSSF